MGAYVGIFNDLDKDILSKSLDEALEKQSIFKGDFCAALDGKTIAIILESGVLRQ